MFESYDLHSYIVLLLVSWAGLEVYLQFSARKPSPAGLLGRPALVARLALVWFGVWLICGMAGVRLWMGVLVVFGGGFVATLLGALFAPAAPMMALWLGSLGFVGQFALGLTLEEGENAESPGDDFPEQKEANLEEQKAIERFVGREAVVVKTLRPVGVVQVDGQPHEALSRFGVREKGTRVQIVGLEGDRLVARPLEGE